MDLQAFKPLLLKNHWFRTLPESLMDALLAQGKIKVLSKGQLLHAKNDPPEGLYCVLRGKIRVSNFSQDGKEMVLTWLDPGSWFGEISLFDGLPRTHDSHAEHATEVLLVPTAAFHDLLAREPQMYQYFNLLLCQRIRATFALIDETGGLSLKGQLAKRLILLSSSFGQPMEGHLNTDVEISQETLAHMLNSSRQTVNKILQNLQDEGIISIQYGRIRIEDLSTLHTLSQVWRHNVTSQ